MRGILRVFPLRTSMTPDDDLAFVGNPPLWRPDADSVAEIHVSCVFTWDIPKAERLRLQWDALYPGKVKLGGPAFEGDGAEPPGAFTPRRYLGNQEQWATITTRGCPNRCPYCLVPEREGPLRELEIQPGNVIQDNNILAASRGHFRKVVSMLRRERRLPQFKGGLEAARFTDWHAEQLRGLRLPASNGLFFACDWDGAEKALGRAARKLRDLPIRTLRCYVLCAYRGDTTAKAGARLRRVLELGFLPFPQLYQPPGRWITYGAEWRKLTGTWSTPAIVLNMPEARPWTRGPK